LFKKGIAQQKAGNFINARTTFEAYDKKFPNDPDTIYQMAETERLMGNSQRAGSLFQRYLKLEGRPNRAQQVNRARLMTAELLGLETVQGQASRAAAAVKQTADSPLLGQALLAQNFLDQAQLAADRGDRSMAMHLMSLAVSYAPTEPAVHEKRGKILVSMHNSLDAEVAFQTAVTYLNEDKDRARLKKMISKVRREGHLDGSSDRIISEEDAKAARVIFEQSEKMWSEGDAAGAIKGFQQVIQYDPNWEQAYIRLGNCLLQRDENSEALNIYRKANLITPQNETIIWGMAMAADNLGDKPLAKDYFRLYLKLPNDTLNADRSRVAEKKIRESLY
jgi:Flp pilus assembly protein TadD